MFTVGNYIILNNVKFTINCYAMPCISAKYALNIVSTIIFYNIAFPSIASLKGSCLLSTLVNSNKFFTNVSTGTNLTGYIRSKEACFGKIQIRSINSSKIKYSRGMLGDNSVKCWLLYNLNTPISRNCSPYSQKAVQFFAGKWRHPFHSNNTPLQFP